MKGYGSHSARTVPVMRIPAVLLLLAVLTEMLCADGETHAAESGIIDENNGKVWQLRVVNGGAVRRGSAANDVAIAPTSLARDAESSNNAVPSINAANFDDPRTRAAWSLQLGRVAPPHAHRMYFGTTAGLPVAGDFNGDGFAEQGMFVDGRWFIDLNGNGKWDAADLQLTLGRPGDLPVVGDWDGDGKADVGVYSLDAAQARGRSGEIPVVGDWNGSGTDALGLFRDGVWNFDLNGDGRVDANEGALTLGQPGDRPIVGDFNRDGRDDLGVYRNGTWILDTNGDRRFGDDDLRYQLGDDGDTPVVGDWDGDGRDQIGVAHR